MPEYLSPGVYVEETSFRSKSIEGVSTSTAGFVGPARWGPVSGRPELITSVADFEHIYGGFDDLEFEDPQGQTIRMPNYLAHGVRAFFEEGGQRLYVSRIFNFGDEVGKYYAWFTPKRADLSPGIVTLRARFPGTAGSIRIFFTLLVGPNILSWSGSTGPKTPTLTRVQEFTLLYVRRLAKATDASKAIQDAADKLPDGSSKTVAELIAQSAEAQASKPADVYQAAKKAAGSLKAAVDAVTSAIDAASVTTAQSVAEAARTEADKSTTEPAKTAADLVAKAAEGEAAKSGATVQSVKDATKKAADDLKAAIDAIATAVNIVTATDPQAIAKAARTEANKAKAEPAKTAADLVAKAAEDEAAKNGATVQSVKNATKTAVDTMNPAADAVANAAATPPAPTPASVAKAARTEANKATAEPAKTAADLVAKVAEGEAAKGDATIQSVKDVTKTAAHDMEVAADGVAGVALTPWLPFSDGTKSLYVSHLVSDTTGSYWKLNDTKLSELHLPVDSKEVEIRPITVLVEISRPDVDAQGLIKYSEPESLGEYNFDPRSATGLTRIFTHKPATRLEALTTPFSIETSSDLTNDQNLLSFIQDLMSSAFDGLDTDRFSTNALRAGYTLVSDKTHDGVVPGLAAYEGSPDFTDITGDPLQMPQNGLLALESVEDISIVAAPGYSANPFPDDVFAIKSAVINHCEKMRYRVAVLDPPPNNLVSEVLDFRNQRSSKYAALYYPWVTILDPLTDRRLNLPPSGFVAGIYARNDTEHAVFKAPANEVVRLAIDFEQRINKAQQDVLNPEGVNCFRYFPGHGFLLWGARTISDDSEWKYVSVRRYFAYLEHSIDRGTQWVVFENNGPQLWDNVRRTIEDFLLNEWKMGALLGDKPEQAYFVRCDRSTMTQNDLDNGRLVCLIGIAVVKPAEFVIFRIGQWTAKTNS
ncbi:MAG: phage tail sheath subtilisin-like domain-containing protein [Ktedonobacteraceae bacterium]